VSDYARDVSAVTVPVKLTVLVEEGVAPLVLALAQVDVVILDSSQGGPERPARVRFRRRDGDVAELAMEIADLLSPRKANLGYELRTTVSAGAGDGEPAVELACPARQVIPLALALRAARGGRTAGRMTGARSSAFRPGTASSPPHRRLRAVR